MKSNKYLILILFLSVVFINNCFASGVIVDKPDYQITSVTYTPEKQMQGANIVFTAVVKNIGDGATLRSSTLAWEVCESACGLPKNWSVKESDYVRGLQVGQEEIETYSHEMAFGTTQVRVRCDYKADTPAGVIDELNEDNNLWELEVETDYPDLIIAKKADVETDRDIWWIPERPIVGQEVTFYARIANIGTGGSVEDFEVEFILNEDSNNPISLGKTKLKDDVPLGPTNDVCIAESKTTWPATPGTDDDNNRHVITAFANVSGSILETDTNNNSSKVMISSIEYPDLIVSDIWWLPENPRDGEEITFYARIDNVGLGGTNQEFDVQFILDANTINELTLGDATIKHHVLPGRRAPILFSGSISDKESNGDFEYEYLTDWSMISGSVSIEKHCPEEDTMCSDQYDNFRYVRLSGANSIIRSESFVVDGSVLIFRAQSSGSGQKWLSICKANSNCQGDNLLQQTEILTSKDTWQSYIMNIENIEDSIEVEIRTGNSANTILMVDDIRMTLKDEDDENGLIVVASVASDVWEATPGIHTITAQLSEQNEIIEDPAQDPNKQLLTKNVYMIERADYELEKIIRTPSRQHIGKDFTYTAVITNTGADTFVESSLNWFLKQDGEYGQSLETDTIPGLLQGDYYVHTFILPATSGTIEIRAICNDDHLLDEANWTEEPGLDNYKTDYTEVWEVDLAVKDVWWIPEYPLEGEEVTFYARIDNLGSGGAVTDFDVHFIVDEGREIEVDLKNTTVKDDVLYAQHAAIPGINGDFEGNCANELSSRDRLCDWYILAGGVSAESYCAADDTQCMCKRGDTTYQSTDPSCITDELYGNQFFARLYGGGTIFQSGKFFLEGDILEFKAQVNGSGTKQLRLCEAGTNCNSGSAEELIVQTYSDKSYWNAYVIDISEFSGKSVYIDLRTIGTGNMEFWVDDFRLSHSTDHVIVTTAVSKDTWVATPGSHEISVKADVTNVIPELAMRDYDPVEDTTNTNNVKKVVVNPIGNADYMVSLSLDTPEQIEGREVQVTADILNISTSGTTLETDVYWYTCREADNPECGAIDWKSTWGNPAKKLKVPALAAGQSYTSVFTFTGEYGMTHIRAEVNPEKTVEESVYSNNDSAVETIDIIPPQLVVKSVWWLPEQPKDGQEVTFYAAIENESSGGTVSDFEVNFSVIETTTNEIEDLGATKIKDDVLMANRRVIFEEKGPFATGSNEDNILRGWTIVSGSVSVVSRCFMGLTNCELSNEYYTYLYGTNTVLQSPYFELTNHIEFSGFTEGSGTKKVRIKELVASNNEPKPDDPILIEKEYTEKTTWRSNIINIPALHMGKKVYLELITEGAANAAFVVDDFRMNSLIGHDVLVTIPTSKSVWTAKPGSYSISVAVDFDGVASTGLQQEIVDIQGNPVQKAEYSLTQPLFDVQKQVQGQDIVATTWVTNNGASTLVESELQWTIAGKTTKENIDGLASGQTYTSTITFTPEYGETEVKVVCDANDTIIETNENNNENLNTVNIDQPTLDIGQVWWSPEIPNDGEEVTFYARIDNLGKGGTSEDFEVRFLIRKGETGTTTEISKDKVASDIPFAYRRLAFDNSDFSGQGSVDYKNKLHGWQVMSGNVFVESRCTSTDANCKTKIVAMSDGSTLYGNEFYVRLYGANTILKSPSFTLSESGVLLFKANLSGSGNKRIQIRSAATDAILKDVTLTGKSWSAKVLDISDLNYNSGDVYLQLMTEGAANATLMIDDIRMAETSLDMYPSMVAVVQSSKTWIAQSSSTVPYYVHVEATDNTEKPSAKSILYSMPSAGMADYKMLEITHTPQEQVKGRTISFTAVLENISTSVSKTLETELTWFTCYQNQMNCGDENWENIWKKAQTDTVTGLASNEKYSSTFELTTEYDDNLVRVFCDSGDVLVEDDEDNNLITDMISVDMPDFRVGEIFWSPEKPADGEEMIFYAQIDNIGDGGSTDDIEVTFTINDANGTSTSIDADKLSDEVIFANRALIFDNSDFDFFEDNGSLYNWLPVGSVFVESRAEDIQYGGKLDNDGVRDTYYARIYGDGSKLISPPIKLDGHSIIFKGQTTGSGIKQVILRKQLFVNGQPKSPSITDPIILTQEFLDKSPWRVLVIDISKYNNEDVYLEIKTSGAANSEFLVDDFRMARRISNQNYVVAGTVQSKNGWAAIPGNHSVTVEVDSKQGIAEMDERNNSATKQFTLDNQADYVVTSMTYKPSEQVQGKYIPFTALLENTSLINSTLIESELQWYVCQGDLDYCNVRNKWESKSKEKITGLAAGAVYTSTFDMEVTFDSEELTDPDAYLLSVKVVCDVNNSINEGNAGGTAEDNNEQTRVIPIKHPDLTVGNIWWLPEKPSYGEEVMFYARIDNLGAGGTVEDFEVNFYIDDHDADLRVDLGAVKMTTEVPFALRTLMEADDFNGSFESRISPWQIITGSVFWESRCPEEDPVCSRDINGEPMSGDLHYAKLYGTNTIFRSKIFQLNSNSLLFRGQTTGSGTKKLLIRQNDKANNYPVLIERTYTDKDPWRAYVIDIRTDDAGNDLTRGQEVFIELQTSGAANATFMVDDFRMGEDATSKTVVGYIEAKGAWTATPDLDTGLPHSITVKVDIKDAIKETNESNQSLTIDIESPYYQFPSIGRPDYIIDIAGYTPQNQIQGRNIIYTALVTNIGYTTYVDSELKWYTCKGNADTCTTAVGYADYWKVQQTDKITGGINAGGQYTVVYNLPAEYHEGTSAAGQSEEYTLWLRLVADEADVLLEENKLNNTASSHVTVGHPDLIISDIWWTPEKPLDGEEVTFYAQIENQGIGGTLQDFEVNFIVDKDKDTVEDLGSAKIQDDIIFGNRLPIFGNYTDGDYFGNSSFESESDPLSGWQHDGDIVIADRQESTETEINYYAVMTGPNALLKSSDFIITKNTFIFYANSYGYGTKELFICKAGTPCDLNTNDIFVHNNYDEPRPWRAYHIDVSDYIGETVYLKLVVGDSETELANKFAIDDFHLTNNIGGFESYPILSESLAWPVTQWTRYSGEVYLEDHHSTTTVPSDVDRMTNKKYAVVSGPDARLVSPVFTLKGDAIIFKGQVTGSGNKYLTIRQYNWGSTAPLSTDPILFQQTYGDKSPWRAYLIDISDINEKDAYFEITTEGTGNMSFLLDDFRMEKAPWPYGTVNVATAVNTKKWLARPYSDITVLVDAKNQIFETSRQMDFLYTNTKKRRSGTYLSSFFTWHGEDNNSLTRKVYLAKKYTYNMGDIDGNGSLDLKDVIIVAKLAATFFHPLNPDFDLDKVDVNGDKQLGIAEIIYLMSHIAGQPTITK
jgi:subtilase family serine protease/membrane-bound inhibitor of C-type lysozyme